MAQTFPETTLSAGGLILRPLSEVDADDVAYACQDAENLQTSGAGASLG